MLKRVLALLFASMLAFPLGSAALSQTAPEQSKEARWEGNVIRSSKDKSTLTVRGANSEETRTVQYDNSTKFVSQEHGSKKVNDITAADVKDGDFVICVGTWSSPIFHATLISKRLSHPQQ
jgi:hypothetical protein